MGGLRGGGGRVPIYVFLHRIAPTMIASAQYVSCAQNLM